MTIHNFYLVAACLIWVSILLILYVKILAARFRCFLRRWAKYRVTVAFSAGCSLRRRRRIARRFYRYSRDELLFRYLCDCYRRYLQRVPQEGRSCLTQGMMKILDSRISTFRDEDPIQRQLLMQYISSTQLSSENIDRFVAESSCGPFQSGALTRLKTAR